MDEKKMNLPSVSFIIPTLNSERDIEECLNGIKIQNYPKNKIKILIMDGGSQDNTVKIANSFGAFVLSNPKVIAEYGKAIGIKKTDTNFFILLDSDNLIKDKLWLKKMITPMVRENNLIGVESQLGTYPEMNIWDRYSALMRIGDPIARMLISKPKKEKKEDYTILTFKQGERVVTGANGFVWNFNLVKKYWKNSNIFEEANFGTYLCEKGYCSYAIPNNGKLYHSHIKSLNDFIKKRKKIAGKFLKRKSEGRKTWLDSIKLIKQLFITIYCFSIIFPLIEAIKNSIKDRDLAWFIHPITCFVTAWIYSYNFIKWRIKND